MRGRNRLVGERRPIEVANASWPFICVHPPIPFTWFAAHFHIPSSLWCIFNMASTSNTRSAKLVEQEAEVSFCHNLLEQHAYNQVERILRAFKLK